MLSFHFSEMAPLTDSKQQDRLLRGMIELYDNQMLTDVILVAEGKDIACHRSVLAASSLYFRLVALCIYTYFLVLNSQY